jgi:uncharacterized protein (TIGR03086 family)
MDELLARFLQAQREFGARVHAIGEEHWSWRTPDTEWSVADLVRHLVDEQRWVAPLLHGLDLDSAAKVVEGTRSLPVDGGVGANLAEEWDEAATTSSDAVNEPGALDRTVQLSRGSTPVREYLGEMTFDAVVHSWDLGRAIAYSDELPGELIDYVWSSARGIGDLSASGLFDRPVDVPADASALDRLVALTGRDPRWRPDAAS